jgi:hypothetical protein
MKRTLQIMAFAMWFGPPVSFAIQDVGSQPLPSLETVLERVVERAKKEDDERAFKQQYSYVRSLVTEQRNADGGLQSRREKTRTNNPAAVRIASRTRSSASKPKRAESRQETSLDGRAKAFEKSDFALDGDLLSRFQFTLVGRETLRGRPALVVDFKPAAKQPPEKTLKDRFINKAAGRAWVDEEEYALVKANLRLTERVSVIGGLVGAVWRFDYSFDRERTEDGFWYARFVGWHLEGREVFFRRVIDYREEKSDIQKVR